MCQKLILLAHNLYGPERLSVHEEKQNLEVLHVVKIQSGVESRATSSCWILIASICTQEQQLHVTHVSPSVGHQGHRTRHCWILWSALPSETIGCWQALVVVRSWTRHVLQLTCLDGPLSRLLTSSNWFTFGCRNDRNICVELSRGLSLASRSNNPRRAIVCCRRHSRSPLWEARMQLYCQRLCRPKRKKNPLKNALYFLKELEVWWNKFFSSAPTHLWYSGNVSFAMKV